MASHHMEKLCRLGVLRKSELGEYFLKEEVKVGALKSFLRLGRLMLPRHLFYAVFFTTILAAYLLLYPKIISVHQLMALISISAAAAIAWYEAIRIWREAPF